MCFLWLLQPNDFKLSDLKRHRHLSSHCSVGQKSPWAKITGLLSFLGALGQSPSLAFFQPALLAPGPPPSSAQLWWVEAFWYHIPLTSPSASLRHFQKPLLIRQGSPRSSPHLRFCNLITSIISDFISNPARKIHPSAQIPPLQKTEQQHTIIIR